MICKCLWKYYCVDMRQLQFLINFFTILNILFPFLNTLPLLVIVKKHLYNKQKKHHLLIRTELHVSYDIDSHHFCPRIYMYSNGYLASMAKNANTQTVASRVFRRRLSSVKNSAKIFSFLGTRFGAHLASSYNTRMLIRFLGDLELTVMSLAQKSFAATCKYLYFANKN